MLLKVIEFADNLSVLSGSQEGRATALRLAERAAANPDDVLLVLDFQNVRVATASFLREAVLGLRQLLTDPDRLVAITNCAPQILEDFSVLLAARQECLAAVEIQKSEKLSIQILGALDLRLQKCFRLLADEGEATAPALAKLSPKEKIGITGWNNRLATLANLGLAIAVKDGRTKLYTTFTGVHRHGSRFHRKEA